MVSLLIDIPEPLHQALRDYLERNKFADQDVLVAEAIALYLQAQEQRQAA